MKTFDAPSALLQTPDDWFDASTYVLAAPKTMGFTPTLVVNVTRRVLLPELQRHIDQQIYELQKLAGFQLLEQQPATVVSNRQTGSITFIQNHDKQASPVYQKQIYHKIAQTIWCLTATCPASANTLIMPSLEAVMATFKPQKWEGDDSAG